MSNWRKRVRGTASQIGRSFKTREPSEIAELGGMGEHEEYTWSSWIKSSPRGMGMAVLRTPNNDRLVGTSYYTFINIPYSKLVEKLGKPTRSKPTEKTKKLWQIVLDGKNLTVYDWKQKNKPLSRTTEWSIGAESGSNKEVETLRRYLLKK